MASIVILFVSLVSFAAAAHLMGREILSKRSVFAWRTSYSQTALKVERSYRILVFGILAAMAFWSLAASFLQVLSGEPF